MLRRTFGPLQVRCVSGLPSGGSCSCHAAEFRPSTMYYTTNPLVSERPHNRRWDASKLRELPKRLDTSTITTEEIDNVAADFLDGEIVDLASATQCVSLRFTFVAPRSLTAVPRPRSSRSVSRSARRVRDWRCSSGSRLISPWSAFIRKALGLHRRLSSACRLRRRSRW